MASRTQNQRSQLLSDLHHHNVNLDTREIFLHSHPDNDEDSGIDYRVAATFLKNLTFLNNLNSDAIKVHMFSDGGSVSDGFTIYDAIKNSNSHITMIGYGSICSMATVILQAADVRVLAANTQFMVHHGSLSIEASQLQVESYMEYYTKVKKMCIDIYAERCIAGPVFTKSNAKKSDIEKFIGRKLEEKSDWWLSAREAIEYGFADSILGE